MRQSTAQRRNLLRAAFAGQLVPQDPNDEPASVLLERMHLSFEHEYSSFFRSAIGTHRDKAWVDALL